MRERLFHGNVAPVGRQRRQRRAARAPIKINNPAGVRAYRRRAGRTWRPRSVFDAGARRSRTTLPASVPRSKKPLAPIRHARYRQGNQEPPPLALALPAGILLDHPAVVAARREPPPAGRKSVVCAGRPACPALILSDLLATGSGRWARPRASTAWLVGRRRTVGFALRRRGGARQMRLRRAGAVPPRHVGRRRRATASRDVEDALAGQQSAQQRIATSRGKPTSRPRLPARNEARWRAGAISMFELEDSRRQFNAAQEKRDSGRTRPCQAWVALGSRTASGRVDLQAAAPTGRDIMNSHPDPEGSVQPQPDQSRQTGGFAVPAASRLCRGRRRAADRPPGAGISPHASPPARQRTRRAQAAKRAHLATEATARRASWPTTVEGIRRDRGMAGSEYRHADRRAIS